MTEEYNPNENSNDPERTLKSAPVPEALNNTWTKSPSVQENGSSAATAPSFPRVVTTPPPPPPLMRESAVRERNRRRHSRKSGGEWAWVIVAGVLLSVVLIIGLIIMMVVQNSSTEQEIIPTSVANLSSLPTPVSFRSDDNGFASGQSITLDNGFSMVLEPWDGQSRFTILLMGIDRRPGETGLAYRTDTMMLASIDPATKTLGLLSIPRDLYIAVPGYAERQRANSAMVLGEVNQFGSGPDLAMRSIQYNLGIRIHDYIVVDFNAVVGVVDAIDGIDITTDYTINDPEYPDMNYGYDPFYLAAGEHTLDGQTALKFARTRHGDSDIERSGRQQQVVFAIRDKVLGLNMIPQLIINAPSLLSSYEQNIQTSLSLEDMIRLAWYLKDIPNENIQSGVIDYQYLANYTTSQNAQVLIPGNNLSELMVEIFGPNYSQ